MPRQYWRDSSTELDYADQRFYNSISGRFMTADGYRSNSGPRDPGSWNRYTYDKGDPINYNDPSGQIYCNLGPGATCGDGSPGDGPGWGDFLDDTGHQVYSLYANGGVVAGSVNWDSIFGFAATQAIPFPTGITGTFDLAEWLRSLRAPWLLALAASIGSTSDGHLPPDPSTCPDKDKFWKPDKAPHHGWTWKGGQGSVPGDQ
jgi:RHS repeat-associated protein